MRERTRNLQLRKCLKDVDGVNYRTIRLNGELYTCGSPRRTESGLYTCEAWKQGTGREIRNFETLNSLGRMLLGKDRDAMSSTAGPRKKVTK